MAATHFVQGDLGYLLGQANHAFAKDFDAHLRAAGLSAIEWRVLAALHGGGALSVSQLAQEVLAKQPTVTKLVQRMGEQGWVRFLADPADQRRTLVEATAAGKRLARPLIVRARPRERAVAGAGRRRAGRAQEAAGEAGALVRLSGPGASRYHRR